MDSNLTTERARRASGARPLRILLSAYACEPNKGSEPGIGWRWALALARSGHEVWVLTRASNRPAIEKALGERAQARLHFVYYDLRAWARGWKHKALGARLYYLLWQLGAYRTARELTRNVAFDVAHHITFGVFRHPSCLAFLDLPFVFGPVGGGETAPRELRETFPLRGYLGDLVRDAANWAVRIDPLMALVYRRSAAMLCKTPETVRSIPLRYREKCVVQAEVGTDGRARVEARDRTRPDREFRVLYVGRLVYWKGLHLGLMAFAMFRQTRPDARLTVIGSGPDEAWLRRIARLLGLEPAITWVPRLEQSEVMRIYPRHDAFLFPSLHGSSGNAVLEALSCGVPVVCLDAGGPAVLVDSSCGIKVGPGSPHAVVERLADALLDLAEDPARRQAMGEAAARHAHDEFCWPRQAARMVSLYRALCVKHQASFGAREATA